MGMVNLPLTARIAFRYLRLPAKCALFASTSQALRGLPNKQQSSENN